MNFDFCINKKISMRRFEFILGMSCFFISSILLNAKNMTDSELDQNFKKLEYRKFLEEGVNELKGGEVELPKRRIQKVVTTWKSQMNEPLNVGTAPLRPHETKSLDQTFKADFFVWRFFFELAGKLDEKKELDPQTKEGLREIAIKYVKPMERGPNNRSFHYALGALWAYRLFPDLKESSQWKNYAEAVWNDYWIPGDCYEPGYVAHWFPPLIELGLMLGHEKELKSDRSMLLWKRLREHISPSGIAIQPGDAKGVQEQTEYVNGFINLARLTDDLSWLALVSRILKANSDPDSSLNKSDFMKNQFAKLIEKMQVTQEKLSSISIPITESCIQFLFPNTHPITDRLILCDFKSKNGPYLGVYLNDRAETLLHAHEDNRGAVYHYEANGSLYLKNPGWIKWTGAANSFVVADELAQFPLPLTRGITPQRWYKGSGNLSLIRDLQESEEWNSTPNSNENQSESLESRNVLWDKKTNLGYSYMNPDSFSGKRDQIEIKEITLRFLAIPEQESERASEKGDHYLTTLSFDPGLAWYREYRPVVKVKESMELMVSKPRFVGAKGELSLYEGMFPPDGTKLVYYAPESRGKEGRVIPRSEWSKWISESPVVSPSGAQVWMIRCPKGRLDLILPVKPKTVDIAKEYTRVEVDYRITSSDGLFLRAPIGILVNEKRPRSLYLDGQQGGRLMASEAKKTGKEQEGFVRYLGVYGADTEWSRRFLLTQEGILVVLDDFKTGKECMGQVGGPVWQLSSPPVSGLHWFDSSAYNSNQRLLLYFHPQEGADYGVQFQPKLFSQKDYAVFQKQYFQPQTHYYYLSVLIPHSEKISPEEVTGEEHLQGRLVSKNAKKPGITTKLNADGSLKVQISSANSELPKNLNITWNSIDSWGVERN